MVSWIRRTARVVAGLIAIGVAGAFGMALLGTSPRRADIELSPEQIFQTMTGWEATADLADNPRNPHWAAYGQRLLDGAVDEVGINRVRLEVRSGVETRTGDIARFIAGNLPYDEWKKSRYALTNDNQDPHAIDQAGFDFSELDWHVEQSVIPMAQRLEARGEKLWLNVCYVSFRDGRYFQIDPEEYAELVLATYLHLRERHGIVPDSWEVILEPDNSKGAWGGADIGRALVAASARLRKNGFKPAFIAPSVMDTDKGMPYLEEMAKVPGAFDNVVELSYHRYGGKPDEDIPRIAAFAASRGLPTGMLEYWFGRATYDVLMSDLTVGNTSSWQGRVLQGLYDVTAGPNLKMAMRDDVRYNAQFFRHVRMGASRIGAKTSAPGSFDSVAFVNKDGTNVVVVVAARRGEVTIHGLKPGKYSISYAIRSGSAVLPDAVVAAGGPFVLGVPGKGVVTIAGVASEKDPSAVVR